MTRPAPPGRAAAWLLDDRDPDVAGHHRLRPARAGRLRHQVHCHGCGRRHNARAPRHCSTTWPAGWRTTRQTPRCMRRRPCTVRPCRRVQAAPQRARSSPATCANGATCWPAPTTRGTAANAAFWATAAASPSPMRWIRCSSSRWPGARCRPACRRPSLCAGSLRRRLATPRHTLSGARRDADRMNRLHAHFRGRRQQPPRGTRLHAGRDPGRARPGRADPAGADHPVLAQHRQPRRNSSARRASWKVRAFRSMPGRRHHACRLLRRIQSRTRLPADAPALPDTRSLCDRARRPGLGHRPSTPVPDPGAGPEESRRARRSAA